MRFHSVTKEARREYRGKCIHMPLGEHVGQCRGEMQRRSAYRSSMPGLLEFLVWAGLRSDVACHGKGKWRLILLL